MQYKTVVNQFDDFTCFAVSSSINTEKMLYMQNYCNYFNQLSFLYLNNLLIVFTTNGQKSQNI